MKPILLLFLLGLISCNSLPNKEENKSVSRENEESLSLKYARGFEVTYRNGAKWVKITKPYKDADLVYKYLLVQKGQGIPDHDSQTQVVEIPLDRMVCTSTTHIPLLDYLNESDALIGFPTTNYISSEVMRKRIDEDKVKDLGVDSEMNLELLMSLEPEMVMAYTIRGSLGQFDQIKNADIPVIINAEYLEAHPLGRAEWIKFMALFFNKEEMADSVFNGIESKYLELQEKVNSIETRPSVLSGIVYGDTWYLPGGQNYASKIINDAGGNYLWSSDSSTSFLELSFESVFEKANNANYWIGVGSYQSLEGMYKSDNRYSDFDAFKNKNVYTYDARKGAKGGSEFLELGYLRPDKILEDLIKILHPELVEDEDLYFHARLN